MVHISEFGHISNKIDDTMVQHMRDATFFLKAPHLAQCIDGRRTHEESNFGMSIPGGSIGLLAVMLSVLEETFIAQIPNFKEKALEVLFDVLGGERNLSYHTDDHACNGQIGCGHIQLLLGQKARDLYGLSDESAHFIHNVLGDYKDKAIVNVLKGHHQEKGIIKVYSTHYSLHANCNDSQYFIYTPKLCQIATKEVARKIYTVFVKDTSSGLTVDALWYMLQYKMNLSFYHTILELAPELPVYVMKHSLSGGIRFVDVMSDKAKNIDMDERRTFDL